MANNIMIKDLIEYLVKAMVVHANQVQIKLHDSDEKVHVEIFVASSDRGRVIGKEGRAIKALRNLIEVLFPTERKITIDLNQ